MLALFQWLLILGCVGLTVTAGNALWDRISPLDEDGEE